MLLKGSKETHYTDNKLKEDILKIQDSSGNTALHLAAANGNQCLVRIFLHYGANASIQNYKENTSLHFINDGMTVQVICKSILCFK